MTPQKTDPDLPVSVQGSRGGRGQQWPAAGSGALNTAVLGASSAGISPFEGGLAIIAITPSSFTSHQATGKENSPSSVQFSHSVVWNSVDPMNCSTPCLPVHQQTPEFTQTHVH